MQKLAAQPVARLLAPAVAASPWRGAPRRLGSAPWQRRTCGLRPADQLKASSAAQEAAGSDAAAPPLAPPRPLVHVPAANNCVPAEAVVAAILAPAAAAAGEAGGGRAAAATAAAAVTPAGGLAAAVALPLGTSSSDEEEMVEGHDHAASIERLSMDDMAEINEMVHGAFQEEIENINAAVHEAFAAERADFDLQVGQTVQEAVETAVETALLDRSFDMRANVNTLVALTGVILYWRGVWNLFDNWLGTENFDANLGSLLIGLSVMLLFRVFKLPLAEFW